MPRWKFFYWLFAREISWWVNIHDRSLKYLFWFQVIAIWQLVEILLCQSFAA
jgi:hypothetical protein